MKLEGDHSEVETECLCSVLRLENGLEEDVGNMGSFSLTLPLAWRTDGQSWRFGTPCPAKRTHSHSGSNYYFCI